MPDPGNRTRPERPQSPAADAEPFRYAVERTPDADGWHRPLGSSCCRANVLAIRREGPAYFVAVWDFADWHLYRHQRCARCNRPVNLPPEDEPDDEPTPTRHDACPDGGACGHGCAEDGPCWRVLNAGPLSAAKYPGDRWPADVVNVHLGRAVLEGEHGQPAGPALRDALVDADIHVSLDTSDPAPAPGERSGDGYARTHQPTAWSSVTIPGPPPTAADELLAAAARAWVAELDTHQRADVDEWAADFPEQVDTPLVVRRLTDQLAAAVRAEARR